MKILYLIDTLEIGGAEKSLLDIVSGLEGVEALICYVYKGGYMTDAFESRGFQVFHLGAESNESYFESARKFRRLVNEICPDIVHATLFRSELISRIALWRNSKVKLVGSLVGDTYGFERKRELSRISRIKLLFLMYFDRFTSKRVDGYTAISNFLKKSFVEKLSLNPDIIEVIPRGRRIYNANIQDSYNRHFVIFSVGRLVKLKGHSVLIDAFQIISKSYPDALLRIAGDGHEYSNLNAQIQRLGLQDRVFLLGRIDDVNAKLSESDLFVFPSYYEGLGGALIEAMIAGKPIVASDIEVIRETIDDGKTGLLFSTGDIFDLVRKIEVMINEPHRAIEMGRQARLKAEQKFDIEVICKMHQKHYQGLICQ